MMAAWQSAKAPPVAKPTTFMAARGGILQRKCACGGNPGIDGVCEDCRKKRLQTKLAIGASNDPLEHEADRVADQVLSASVDSEVSTIPRRFQRAFQNQTNETWVAPDSVERVISQSGRPLEPALRKDMERRFGHDFSKVRVHSGESAEESAREVNAHAYTVGHNIAFGSGRFAPATHEGRRLIAHELTHVVQQADSNGIHLGQNPEPGSHYLTTNSVLPNQQLNRQEGKEAGVQQHSDTGAPGAEAAPPTPSRLTQGIDNDPTTNTPPSAAPATASSAQITLETGNTGAGFVNDLVHQQICVDRLGLGPKRCFSFGKRNGIAGFQLPQFSSTWLGWDSLVVNATLQGEIYEPDPVSTATVVGSLAPTVAQGTRWLDYMTSTRLALKDAYSIARHNCRTFSQWEFRDAPSHW